MIGILTGAIAWIIGSHLHVSADAVTLSMSREAAGGMAFLGCWLVSAISLHRRQDVL